MRPIEKKILVMVTLALAGIYILRTPAIADAFWTFVTVGQIPGTDVVLTPDTVIFTLPGLFAVILVVAFWKELRASLRRSPQVPPSVASEQVSSRSATALSEPARSPHDWPIIITPPRRQRHRLVLLRRSFVVRAAQVKILLQRSYAAGQRLGSRGVWRTVQWGQWLLKRTERLTRRAVITSVILAKRGWLWAEPHIRQFDRFLEKKFHQYRFAADLLAIGNECLKYVRKLRQTK